MAKPKRAAHEIKVLKAAKAYGKAVETSGEHMKNLSLMIAEVEICDRALSEVQVTRLTMAHNHGLALDEEKKALQRLMALATASEAERTGNG